MHGSIHLQSYRPDRSTEWYDRLRSAHSEQMWALLGKYVKTSARVLEVGPGPGHFARATVARGLAYDAIEPADLYREALAREGIAASPEVVPPIERESKSADLIHASMFIENLPTANEAAAFVHDAHRVLDDGGVLSLIFPNYLTWGSFFFDEHYTHSFITTARRVEHLLETQGFDVVYSRHVLGWFWVETSLAKNTARHLANCVMRVVHLPFVRWLCHYTGLGKLHWKASKSCFEAVVVVARKAEPATH